MKVLIIGGNRFVGLRLSHYLDAMPDVDLSIFNRTGQVAHTKNSTIFKGDRANLEFSHLDKEWDLIYDFACYNKSHAEESVRYFTKVGRYIFISTASVYDSLPSLTEDKFDPKKFDLNLAIAKSDDPYQFGKRQAEAVFSQKANFESLLVRFPFILGLDDYTGRLDFHVNRTMLGESIFVDNPTAQFSVIHSQDAAQFLKWTLNNHITEALNVGCQRPISILDLFQQIELLHDIKPIIAKTESAENRSPYSVPVDWFLNVGRMLAAGFKVRPKDEWLSGLLGRPENMNGPRRIH